MGLLVAEDPAAAMEVHHDRQGAARALRPDEANPHRSGGADRKGRILDGGRQLGDRLGLSAGQDVTGGIRAQCVDRRSASGRQRVHELLRSGLQDGCGGGLRGAHVSASLNVCVVIRRMGGQRADRHRVAPGKWSEIRIQPDTQGRVAPAHALMSDRGYTQPLEAARSLAASPGEPTFEPSLDRLASSASRWIADLRRM